MEYEFIINNGVIKQVAVEQFNQQFLPKELALLHLTPRGIKHIKETTNKTVTKYGTLNKCAIDRRFTSIGRHLHRKILRLLEKYRFSKDMCQYSINSYDTLKEFDGNDREEFRHIVKICEKHSDIYIRSKSIFFEVFHRLDRFNTYAKYINFMSQIA